MRDRDELLDIKQAASFLHVSETSLRRWTNEGILPCLRVGRRRERRFLRADLIAFMDVQPASRARVRADAAGAAQAVLTDGPQHLHLCMVYTTDAGRTRLAVDFLHPGIRDGSHCLLVARRPVGEGIIARLLHDHADLRSQTDAVVLTEYAATVDAQLEYFEQQFTTALRTGAASVRVVGDVQNLAARVTPDEVVAYELGYERLYRRFPVSTACLYDARKFDSMQLITALHGHHDSLSRPVMSLLG